MVMPQHDPHRLPASSPTGGLRMAGRDQGDGRSGGDPGRADAHGVPGPQRPVRRDNEGSWARQWWGVAIILVTLIFVVAVLIGLVVAS